MREPFGADHESSSTPTRLPHSVVYNSRLYRRGIVPRMEHLPTVAPEASAAEITGWQLLHYTPSGKTRQVRACAADCH